MRKQHFGTTFTSIAGSLLVLTMGASAWAQGQPQAVPYPAYPPPPPAQPAGPPAPPSYGPPAPMYAPPAAERVIPVGDENAAASDHDLVVGRIGFEAVQVANGLNAGVNGNVAVNAAGVRMWLNRNMAFNADLAFAVGSGSVGTTSNPTYMGIGPGGGVTFLLGNWKHVSVGASPQLQFLYFAPGGEGSKGTTILNLQGLVEAELHLGFIGAPSLSLSFSTGLQFSYTGQSDTKSDWTLGMCGPFGFWDSITNAALRFYM